MSVSAASVPRERPTATLIVPCLNEAATLGAVLEEARAAIEGDDRFDWTVLVADNGSTDGSPDIAAAHGAAVVAVAERGYGAALDGGIRAATSEWVAYLDADGTYRPADAVRLVHLGAACGAGFAVGNRLRGAIAPGAMPPLHRYLGTPVLTWLLRRLHGSPLGDCNSGIRAVSRSAYIGWRLRSTGMEFASEMLVRASRAGTKTVETPVSLSPSPPGRVPHLRSWRDGMRHLLVLLAMAPGLFWHTGVVLLSGSLAFALPAAAVGMVRLPNGVEVLGPHSQSLALLFGWLGAAFVHLGLVAMDGEPPERRPAFARWLSTLSEGTLFWMLVSLGGGMFAGALSVGGAWISVSFAHLSFQRFTLALLYFTIVPGTLLLGLFHAHLQRRIGRG
ncbi:MAG: hypothetical protein RL199_146 [Pseudomonadota bacterium]|jgi:hypothetical protein